jgi:hypothetical protein
MDPIHPIPPGPATLAGPAPVDRLPAISRERDRPAHEQAPRRRPPAEPVVEPEDPDEGEDGRPRVDVRV